MKAIASRLSDVQQRLLVEQYYAPSRTVTASELAELASVRGGHPAVNAQYGRLGHMFCDETGFEPSKREGGGHRWWSVWSSGYSSSKGFLWEMLPPVAEALESLGWVASEEVQIPEEVTYKDQMVEGASRQILVNAYERSQEARRKCIEHHGSSCMICGLDFGKHYGLVAEGYIHVHHLRPLSEIDAEYAVDPVEDLRPVCPNCHSVIHLGKNNRTIEEVRELIRLAGGEDG